ncbi:MAG: hypothetical protein ACPGRD_01850 [Planktomarina sp.]
MERIANSPHEYSLFENFRRNECGNLESWIPDWTIDEAQNIRLLVESGELRLQPDNDGPHLDPVADVTGIHGQTKLALTIHGNDMLDQGGVITRALRNVAHNLASITVSVVTAVSIAILLFWLGL